MNFAILKKTTEPCCAPSPVSDKPRYPELRLENEQVDAFKKLIGGELNVDREFTLDDPKFKISGISDNEYGKSLTICLVECDGAESGESEEDEGSEEEGKEEGSKSLKERLKESPAPKKPLKERLRYDKGDE